MIVKNITYDIIYPNLISGVRRLVIVEAGSNRVEGIISLTDIFKFLLG